ncbi:DUF6687 family protein [Paenactinomyces guangxiensis]|uniref:Uncharacterized protein n=1 Tax=Paenactinomyces guangxiensis TaxID=1490290 RepID=A0A7W1WTE5_9BACL|nr:DUF6687 family protein [Paenactinomyces guangxiensis]MBA4495658.1 hypothetical protein [Paenactinomyces guangxiensis]MBH8592646.1 hypothetical protein [Paenactinomyces guangxiensis]
MKFNFYILGSEQERPSSRKTIFVDGSPDSSFREGIDMELSHWIPNQTPERYKADTSTEICMKFISEESSEDWDLAINNHLDVDGVLSIFTLVYPDFALAHRQTIIEAAEMGDFWAWGSEPAQRLFQGLTLLMNDLRSQDTDIQTIYEKCFQKAMELIEGNTEDERILKGIRALQDSLHKVESGEIERKVYHNRFVHYHIPAKTMSGQMDQALKVPEFNAALADDLLLYPQVRSLKDREKVHMVSIEGKDGTYYDLWYPGYMWADTPDSWRAPGFIFKGSTNGYFFGYPPLQGAIDKMKAAESAKGTWTLVQELSPFSSIKGRNYPVVLSFIGEGHEPAASHLKPDEVAQVLAEAFKG